MGAAPLLAELRHGHPWLCLCFLFVGWLFRDLGWTFSSYWGNELITTGAGDGRGSLELSFTPAQERPAGPGRAGAAPPGIGARRPRTSGRLWLASPRPAVQGKRGGMNEGWEP